MDTNSDIKEVKQKIEEMDGKIDKMFKTVDKLRKYFLWTGIITVILFVLPLIGLVFAIPQFISTISSEASLTQ